MTERMTVAEFLASRATRKTLNDLVFASIRQSSMDVRAEYEGGTLSRVTIRLSGTIANIPAMKNRKLPGLNIPNIETIAKLRAMSTLWIDWQVKSKQQPAFGLADVFCLVLCGHRGKRSFDADNCGTTISDWLEPRYKPVGKREKTERGWGIGLVANDRQVTTLAAHARSFGIETKDSIVIVERMDQTRRWLPRSLQEFGYLESYQEVA